MGEFDTMNNGFGGGGSGKAILYDKAQNLTDEQAAQARDNLKLGASASDAVSYGRRQNLNETHKGLARENIGAAKAVGEEPELIAGDIISLNDPVTVQDKFNIRTTAGVESIDSKKDALLLQIIGGCGDTEAKAFKIHSLKWNGANALNPAAWESGKTNGYITGAVSSGHIIAGSNKLCIIRCPKCEVGEYGTAEKNNGYLLTDNDNNNLKAGEGVIIGVWYSPELPAVGTEVTAVTEHVFTGHPETFYIPEEGYLIVEVSDAANIAQLSAHLAWSKDYNVFAAYVEPDELVVAVPALTSVFETQTINGKTCIVLRRIEQGKGGIFDYVIIYPEGGGNYERNLVGKLLTELSWTEEEITAESIEGEEEVTRGYRYSAVLPSTGTYAAMLDGFFRSDVEGMTLKGYVLSLETAEQIDPATAFAGKYVDYQMATPVRGTHNIDPTGKKPDDMGTEEVVGGDSATGTIVISYMRNFRDTMRALLNEFKSASAELAELRLTKPLYCVGEWLENANIASPIDQDNPDALAVFGNKLWALDWRPFLVDMTAVEGETKKKPVMELRKNNWLRDIYGNWAPVVGITTAMRDECMANTLYTDAECTNEYCASGSYSAEAFLALCNIDAVNGVKRLTHPKLYKAANTEVTHYLMPWESTETKYSIFVGRKDEVYLLDNLIGASGKEWNGIISANVNFWDGMNVEMFALKPTGICAAPTTAIVENSVAKSRSYFFNYVSEDSYSKGVAGASGCTMFRNNGHYRSCSAISQVTAKNRARANNHNTNAPYPVAEGGYHARNTFLRSIETALGTKNLCVNTRFGSGVSSVDACSNENNWKLNGGLRYKAQGANSWSYCALSGNPAMYYGSGETKTTTNASNWLSGYGPLSKTLEAQIAVSFAVEFGIAADEHFMFNGAEWWFSDPAVGSFTPPTVSEGYMNCRVYKIVTGTFTGYASASATETTEFELEVCVRTGIMLGCDMSGDGGPYWGGGCEVIGECKEAPASGSFGYTLEAYIEPDQIKWVNDNNISINIGQKFACESKYKLAGSVVTRNNAYTRRMLANTPLPATHGGGYAKGECAYAYMGNYWGSAGKRTRVGLRFGSIAYYSNLSARFLFALYSAGNAYAYFCGSAQVLLDVQ